ncbi:hypothetical protein ACFXKX_06815 [Streptomyces scopuliridis]|uniref:hypothetical protein n=1 Tax=Streptomyces scopuliridis TaxID=452529 RepID=UPI00367A62FA
MEDPDNSLLISQKLHRHERTVASAGTRPAIFPRTPAEPPAGVLADHDRSQRQPLYRCSPRPENIRESTLEGLDAAALKGKHGGRPQVITDDMLHTVLRRRALGESVEQIQPDLIIPTGKRKGQNPSVASIYRALAEHAKHEAYLEAVEQAHADFSTLAGGDQVPMPRTAPGAGPLRAGRPRPGRLRSRRKPAPGHPGGVCRGDAAGRRR